MGKSNANNGTPVLVARPRKRFGVRHLQASLMALCSFIAYALRANLSVAIVAMVRPAPPSNNSVGFQEPGGGEGGGGMAIEDAEGAGAAMVFEWDEPVRGALLSAFFWGYMLSQIPGGVLSQRLGGSRLLAGALMSTSVVTLLLPVCAQHAGWKAVFANRVVQGLMQGPVYPSTYTLLGLWVPPHEREIFTTFILGSQLLGPMLASPLCGLMAARWGWPSIFYTFGTAGIATGALLWWLGGDRPADHPRISAEELAYIQSCLNAEQSKAPPKAPRTPWRAVCSSPCVWVLWMSLSVQAMTFFTFLTNIPNYLNGVLHFPLEKNGMLTALPYLTGFLSSLLFTAAANFVRDRKLLSTTNSRKFFNGMASIPISICVVSTAYVSSKAASVALICLSMGFFGATFVGTQANYLDLAPLHTGPIYSVGNMMAAILGVLGPQAVGLIVTDHTDVTQWRIVFWGEAGVLMTAFVFYTWFATGEVQPWNDPDYEIKRRMSLNIQEDRRHERLESRLQDREDLHEEPLTLTKIEGSYAIDNKN